MIEAAKKSKNIFLVMEDILIAQKIAIHLKKSGRVCYYYDNLKKFWADTLREIPDLVIVDVKKMSEGDLVLMNHPRVKDNKLNLAFFYTENTKFLLNSTYNIENYGTIADSENLTGELNALFTRLESKKDIKDQAIDYEQTISRLKNRTAKLVSDISEFKLREEYQKEVLDLVETMDLKLKTSNFHDALIKTISSWEKVLSFGCYELNQTSQKLLSPKYRVEKYFELPELWLGQFAKEGISESYQNMSIQVAIDQFGLDVVPMKIYGAKKHPEFITYFSIDKTFKNNIPWDLFSKLVSNLYSKWLLNQTTNPEQIKNKNFISSWDFLGIIDEHHYNLKSSKLRLINFSFMNLVDVIKDKSRNRFYWKTFYNEFLTELEKSCGADFKVTEFGNYHLFFLVTVENFEKLMNSLEDFSVRFSYWRYFEDSSAMLAAKLLPEIKEIPMTSNALLAHVDKEFDSIDRVVHSATLKTKNLFSNNLNLTKKSRPQLTL